MNKVYIRTYAYNAEKTLARAIESILNQTYSDFIYYLCDNGSTDGTRAIIQSYAERDSRIKPFYQNKNRNYSEAPECLLMPYNIKSDDYYCILDADDEYLPTFIEEMLAFMNENNLDIGVCGSNFLSTAENTQLIGRRIVNQNLLLEGTLFEEYFRYYHVFMRTTWGKLYKGFTLKNTVQDPSKPDSKCPVGYGGDTYNAMQSFNSAERVGLYAKPLHVYYVSLKSSSYIWNSLRVKADQLLHEAALEYLKPYGKISKENEEFLSHVYLNALKDTCDVLFHSVASAHIKIDALYEIFSCDYTKQLMIFETSGDFFKQREAFFSEILRWILSLEEVDDDQIEKYCMIGELLTAFLHFQEGWISFNKIKINYLLDRNDITEAEHQLGEMRTLLPKDEDILNLTARLDNLKIRAQSSTVTI
ncbi:glycosyltransferase family 2 protein [Aminipila luticellarii]|uniref:Glycosyltransferase family 2 protein n=1 Tax=Aminipila luticellarii TaxID=2507160 RepID=A0A410PSW9_9FIRM|nr:glycosyltransferase family 2 protein [Aminipila luticellarii]QAT42014.1 glycosyltransferase family 2 protein [Aminipila luticellarii]